MKQGLKRTVFTTNGGLENSNSGLETAENGRNADKYPFMLRL